jgi:hypothetical protein
VIRVIGVCVTCEWERADWYRGWGVTVRKSEN